MKYQDSRIAVVCFGEVLWDVLPLGKRPGGAPMNVAFHLNQLGIRSEVISSVGDDKLGEELLAFLRSKNIPVRSVQIDPANCTSVVQACIGHDHEVSYDIVAPVAWDFIDFEQSHVNLIKNSEALVFGSLAARNKHSRKTLLDLIRHSSYRVFDVNLRAPHYSSGVIGELLQCSHLVKLNLSELELLAGWHNQNNLTELEQVELLFSHYSLLELLVTKGDQGASYYTRSLSYDCPAYPVEVADTIGSGDSFLAAFLMMKLSGRPLVDAINFAIAMSAFITARTGACPDYSKADLERFIMEKRNV